MKIVYLTAFFGSAALVSKGLFIGLMLAFVAICIVGGKAALSQPLSEEEKAEL